MQTNSDNQEYEPSALATWLAYLKQIPFGDSLNVRIGLGVYGILLPTGGSPDPAEWQSGEWTDKLSFVLSGNCGWPVFPFLIFGMICMGMAICDETEAFTKTWVRLGIFSGVFVCGWYLFAFSSTVLSSPFSSLGLLLGAVIWLVVVHSVFWLLQAGIRNRTTAKHLVTFAGVVILILMIATAATGGGILAVFFLPFLILLILSTPLAFLVYLGMSIRILILHVPARRFTLSQLMVWVTWLTAFAAALQKTIALSFAEYSQLPLEPPENCYVATAASKGFPTIVGSQKLPTATDKPAIVNQQLAIFKAAELTLRAISPKTHCWFRYFYNRLGPLAAARLRDPLRATIAYLCLKPAEWLCRFVLQILLGRQTFQLAKNLYRARAKSTRKSL